jgi:hypothetical protein
MYNQTIPQGIFTTNNTFDRYYLGLFFKEYVLQKEYYPYQFDSWGDKKYYGILDNKGYVIYPKDTALVEYSNSNGVTHKNLLFVVDAFKEMKKYQQDLSKNNKSKNTSIYSQLNVRESTSNVANLYIDYLNKLYVIFRDNILNQAAVKKDIKNISSFIQYFVKFIKIMTKISVFNRSTFIKSKFVPQSINGLKISLDTVGNNLDYRTISNNYIDNPEFDLFIETAGKFGFYVDKNHPWMMVADLESPVMQKYAENYGLMSVDQIFSTCYYTAYTADLESLKNVILSFWNSFAASQGDTTTDNKIVGCKNVFVEISTLNQLNIETFEQYFNVNWQLRMYLYTRILEERLDVTQNKFESLHQESCTINKFYDTEKSLLFINEKISELRSLNSKQPEMLTTPDAVVKLLSSQITALPVEGINF